MTKYEEIADDVRQDIMNGKYSINQQHQIEASNQDIIRHQKEIDYLYKLIGEYVRVDYKNTLLSLNLELK